MALLLCSDGCRIYIYRTATYISKKCNSCNQSIAVSVVNFLPLALYLHENYEYYHGIVDDILPSLQYA